jgi:predicted nucleic acid-binding protein
VILVDSSIWVDHLRKGDRHLAGLLTSARVLCHPFVIGEIALGHLPQRSITLGALMNLPKAIVAADHEVLRFIHASALHGQGIGYVDAHILASIRLTPGSSLWTRDKRLLAAASHAGVALAPPQ